MHSALQVLWTSFARPSPRKWKGWKLGTSLVDLTVLFSIIADVLFLYRESEANKFKINEINFLVVVVSSGDHEFIFFLAEKQSLPAKK